MTRQSTSRPTSRGRIAFTLIELIVAIGAVALISVGIAAIFESIGRTVAGGRRVSVLNQYAALIERQMRADFQSMTREGVLVIRHQYADVDGDGSITEPDDHVALYPDQLADEQRLRRIDELLFFARGEFSSARTPVVPGLTASSSEALVYYGHGIRLDPTDTPPDGDLGGKTLGGRTVRYERPQVNDGTTERPYRPDLALGASRDFNNPNRYAAFWSLLRCVTVLAPPSSSAQSLPSDDPDFLQTLGLFPDEVPDNAIQVGGQPAAPSAFRTLAQLFPADYPFPGKYIRKRGDGPRGRRPMWASGIVDVAAIDLADIRRIVTDVAAYPWNITGESELFDPSGGGPNYFDNQFTPATDPNNPSGLGDLAYVHAWMDDLLPTDPSTGMRVRYEDVMPDFVGTLGPKGYPDGKAWPALQGYRLADQRALGSSVFVPRCTEFIVEYSFGQVVDPAINPVFGGQLIWYGLNRKLSFDGQPPFDVVRPYPFDTTSNQNNPFSMSYPKLDGSVGSVELKRGTLYGPVVGGPTDPLTARFGYTDPTYTPADPDVDPATIPWPWPRLIRVTMTLADPSDPSNEETFQFVFETPEGRQF